MAILLLLLIPLTVSGAERTFRVRSRRNQTIPSCSPKIFVESTITIDTSQIAMKNRPVITIQEPDREKVECSVTKVQNKSKPNEYEYKLILASKGMGSYVSDRYIKPSGAAANEPDFFTFLGILRCHDVKGSPTIGFPQEFQNPMVAACENYPSLKLMKQPKKCYKLDFKSMQTLGHGAFGTVYRVADLNTKKILCIEKIRR